MSLAWHIPSATLLMNAIADAPSIANGTRQDPSIGSLNFIDGKGSAAPPLELTLTPTGLSVLCEVAGGHADQALMTWIFHDGLRSRLTLNTPLDFSTTFEFHKEGRFYIEAINDFGQRAGEWIEVAEVVEDPLELPPEEPPEEP